MVNLFNTSKTFSAYIIALTSIVILGNGIVSAQSFSADTLHWRTNYKLSWADFQAKPDSSSIGMAGTSSSFFYRSYYDGDTIRYEVDCVFFKALSWVKPKYRNAETLKHEQGHFDISEIHARILKQQLQTMIVNPRTIYDDIQRVSDSVHKLENNMQLQYDSETTYPINVARQKKWDKKISSLLL